MTITDTPITIEQFFKGYTELFVPVYQRDYSWQEEQWSDLMSDLLDSNPNPELVGEGHFLGSVLIHKTDKAGINSGEVIDGQQRITTIFLMLKMLTKRMSRFRRNKEQLNDSIATVESYIFKKRKGFRQSNTDTKIPKLQLGRRGKELFKSIICDSFDESDFKGSNEAEVNLSNAYAFFRDKFDGLNYNECIDLLERLAFAEVIVIVSEKASEKNRLFKTLNARGLELSQSDLIKNEICKSANEEELDRIIDRWERDVQDRLGNIKLDTFFFHYLNSDEDYLRIKKDVEKRKGLKNSKDYPFVTEKRVFDVLEQKLSKEETSLDDFLDDLIENIENYKIIVNPTKARAKEAYDYLVGLKVLKITKAYPVILTAKKKLSEKNFTALVEAIEIISFRHSMMRFDPKELENLYFKIIPILSDKNIKSAIKILKEFNTNTDEVTFKEAFEKMRKSDVVSKYILMRILNAQAENVSWSDRAKIHLEHIMPKRPKVKSIWKEVRNQDEDKYKHYCQRLGNLTLLKDKLNQTASNKDFAAKKKSYAKSRYIKNEAIMNQKEWNYATIEKNQKEVYKLAKKLKVWKL